MAKIQMTREQFKQTYGYEPQGKTITVPKQSPTNTTTNPTSTPTSDSSISDTFGLNKLSNSSSSTSATNTSTESMIKKSDTELANDNFKRLISEQPNLELKQKYQASLDKNNKFAKDNTPGVFQSYLNPFDVAPEAATNMGQYGIGVGKAVGDLAVGAGELGQGLVENTIAQPATYIGNKLGINDPWNTQDEQNFGIDALNTDNTKNQTFRDMFEGTTGFQKLGKIVGTTAIGMYTGQAATALATPKIGATGEVLSKGFGNQHINRTIGDLLQTGVMSKSQDRANNIGTTMAFDTIFELVPFMKDVSKYSKITGNSLTRTMGGFIFDKTPQEIDLIKTNPRGAALAVDDMEESVGPKIEEKAMTRTRGFLGRVIDDIQRRRDNIWAPVEQAKDNILALPNSANEIRDEALDVGVTHTITLPGAKKSTQIAHGSKVITQDGREVLITPPDISMKFARKISEDTSGGGFQIKSNLAKADSFEAVTEQNSIEGQRLALSNWQTKKDALVKRIESLKTQVLRGANSSQVEKMGGEKIGQMSFSKLKAQSSISAFDILQNKQAELQALEKSKPVISIGQPVSNSSNQVIVPTISKGGSIPKKALEESQEFINRILDGGKNGNVLTTEKLFQIRQDVLDKLSALSLKTHTSSEKAALTKVYNDALSSIDEVFDNINPQVTDDVSGAITPSFSQLSKDASIKFSALKENANGVGLNVSRNMREANGGSSLDETSNNFLSAGKEKGLGTLRSLTNLVGGTDPVLEDEATKMVAYAAMIRRSSESTGRISALTNPILNLGVKISADVSDSVDSMLQTSGAKFVSKISSAVKTNIKKVVETIPAKNRKDALFAIKTLILEKARNDNNINSTNNSTNKNNSFNEYLISDAELNKILQEYSNK